MTFISADNARKRIAEFKRFDPSKIQDKLKSLADKNISYVLNDLKDAFLYNPLLKQYLLTIRYRQFILFGVERNGFETKEDAKSDALKYLKQVSQGQLKQTELDEIINSITKIEDDLRTGKKKRASRIERAIELDDMVERVKRGQ
jgi:predicted transcriptional regulator